ncbi:response regulator [Methanolobus vulcani]|uniref:Response regulator n=1 Tax=Methanolobus vulcani TaxID=38026 RepID=A0A7Z8KMW6_9EURY|nr:response regulator [Methanolobus vulcani]TQD25084.1 response regulator [Methanolobus vulcani]
MKSILVVEDSTINMELIVCLLEYKGYEIVKAVNGEEALKLVKINDFTLILLDIYLPGIDGYDVLKILKKDMKTKDIHVIAITADAMLGTKEKYLNAGCDSYVTKPYDIHELSKLIATFC